MDHFFQDVPGWCDFADYYRAVVASLPDGAHLVEVGVWQGQSTAALGVEIANSGKALRLDVVDWFKGSPDEGPQGAVGLPDLRSRFEAHVAPVRSFIREIIEAPSVEAARRYTPASLDFVWLDASHHGEDVLADLTAWWPLVKPGGILAGHDADWASVQAALLPWAELAGVEVEAVSARSWQVRKPARVASWWVPPADRRCLVAVASNERTIHRATVESLVSLGWGARVSKAAAAHGFRDVSFAWVSRHTRVDDLRNEAVLAAKSANASHLLFLDADMTWPGDLLDRMLRHHDRGIVSGLYFLKAWPNSAVAFKSGYVNLKTGQVDYVYDEQVLEGAALRPEALVGMGCALVPMAVFDAVPRPWFEYRQDRNGVWSITEDVAFCQKAAAVGCPIYLDPTVKCGHVAAEIVTESHFMRSTCELTKLEQINQRRREAVPA